MTGSRCRRGRRTSPTRTVRAGNSSFRKSSVAIRRSSSSSGGAIGYSLTGVTSEQVLFLLYGTGANGKGTLDEHHQAGARGLRVEHAVRHDRVERAHGDSQRPRGARRPALRDRRETNDGARLNEARVKALTGMRSDHRAVPSRRVLRVEAVREVLAQREPQAHRAGRLARLLATAAAGPVHAALRREPGARRGTEVQRPPPFSRGACGAVSIGSNAGCPRRPS